MNPDRPIRASASGHHLETGDGRPFLWLGDTAWELLHRLGRDDTEHYLRTRAAQGFTVIQTVILAELGGLTQPNAQGDLPFTDLQTLDPNAAYFEHVDWVLGRAAAHGLTVALLPTWGDKVQRWWGVGPAVFSPQHDGQGLEAATARAYRFARFVGERYARLDGLVWVLGGDRSSAGHPEHRSESGDDFARVWQALAEGLRDGDGGRHLVGFHPFGGQTSSGETRLEPFLHLRLIQSGHGHSDIANWTMIRDEVARQPAKPSLDAEPCYEDMPIGFDPARGWYGEREVRRAAYAAVFAGACGHTYGANAVWQMHEARFEPQLHARTTWREALHLPFAATQLRHLRTLLDTPRLNDWTPDPEAIPEPLEHHRRIHALRTDGALMVYLPEALPVRVRVDRLPGERLRVRWFDPRLGSVLEAGTRTGGGEAVFEPPTAGEDWVLCLGA